MGLVIRRNGSGGTTGKGDGCPFTASALQASSAFVSDGLRCGTLWTFTPPHSLCRYFQFRMGIQALLISGLHTSIPDKAFFSSGGGGGCTWTHSPTFQNPTTTPAFAGSPKWGELNMAARLAKISL